jgi:osmoprotectant transport system permease protein
MRTRPNIAAVIRMLACALACVLCAGQVSARPTLTVGSKRFTESYILGDVIRQLAAHVGEARAVHKQGLGNTGIVFAALRTGNIDVYPEYTGTISQELLKNKSMVSIDTMNAQLRPMGLAVGVPLGFNDTYALAMRADQAGKLGIRTIGDLARHPELKFGLSQEFINRSDGWPGVKTTYGLPQSPRGIDHGLAYEAIAGGQIDVTDIYSTDAKIDKYKLRVLDDDRGYFPRYDAVLLYRADLPKRLPRTWAALEQLRGKISADRMIQLNADVELRGQTFGHVATNFLAKDLKVGHALNNPTMAFLSRAFGDDFWALTAQHLYLVFVSLLAAVVIGIPLGVLAARSTTAAQPILGSVSVVQTIPSLALLAVLIPILHRIGDPPTLIALFLYSLLPIVRNTYSGLCDIPAPMRESALALGLPSFARLRLIELPLASRSILAGIKTSAIINVGTATIAAFIGAGGYGQLIAIGYASADNTKLVAGAIAVGILALLVQGAFDLLDRWIVPKGIRN